MHFRILLCLSITLLAKTAGARGDETFGSENLGDGANQIAAGLADVVNQPSRVYRTWVNGNSHYYYDADTEQLNALLREFGEVDVAPREVILRPGKGEVGSFSAVDDQGEVVTESKRIDFNAVLHIVQGVAVHSLGERPPTFTILLADAATLDALHFPEGLSVIAPSAIRARLLERLRSTDYETRGYAASDLVTTEPYTADNVAAIATLLKDDEDWVRSMAALALRQLAAHAKEALPDLRAALKIAPFNKEIRTTIETLENSQSTPTLSPEEQTTLTAIEAYCKKLASAGGHED